MNKFLYLQVLENYIMMKVNTFLLMALSVAMFTACAAADDKTQLDNESKQEFDSGLNFDEYKL